MAQRNQLLQTLAKEILLKAQTKKCYFVGVDGLDGAGKTVFGDELGEKIEAQGGNLIRSSVDFFHNPKAIRYVQGRKSPIGYYEDSFNYPKMKALLLEPLKQASPTQYTTKYFDVTKDAIVQTESILFTKNSILLVDGIFLHRPELRMYWDYSILLDVSREETIKRCYFRDNSGSLEVNSEKNRRYVQGQKIYFTKVNPYEKATIVINNEDFEHPQIIS